MASLWLLPASQFCFFSNAVPAQKSHLAKLNWCFFCPRLVFPKLFLENFRQLETKNILKKAKGLKLAKFVFRHRKSWTRSEHDSMNSSKNHKIFKNWHMKEKGYLQLFKTCFQNCHTWKTYHKSFKKNQTVCRGSDNSENYLRCFFTENCALFTFRTLHFCERNASTHYAGCIHALFKKLVPQKLILLAQKRSKSAFSALLVWAQNWCP